MALTLGTVTISDAGVRSGSGAALRLYDKLLGAVGGDIPEGIEGATAKRSLAAISGALADWAIEELTTHAELRITTADAGIQRADVANVANQPTIAPASDFTGGGIV